MARDDMFVVMYKILAYLYACMKKGVPVDQKQIQHDAMGVGYPYWCEIVNAMVDKGLVKGIGMVEIDQATTALPVLTDPKITPDGVEYLASNSTMSKAREALLDALHTLTPAVVEAIKLV